MDYCLTTDGLFRFRDRIYVLDNIELKMLILREFHAKPYSGHPGYQKTLTVVKKFYYWPNLKKDVAEYVARCFDCHRVKAECKHRWTTTADCNSRVEVGGHFNGLHHRFAEDSETT